MRGPAWQADMAFLCNAAEDFKKRMDTEPGILCEISWTIQFWNLQDAREAV